MLPLWHFADKRSLFVGVLHRHKLHSHSVSILISAPYGPIGIKFENEDWRSCHAAVVRAGTKYELDAGGEVVAVIYLEPTVGQTEFLIPLLNNTVELPGAVMGNCTQTALLRQLYEAPCAPTWASDALDDVLRFSGNRLRTTMDTRITTVIKDLLLAPDAYDASSNAARAVHLSASRFQHLFAEEVGVTFTRYRLWCRVRHALDHVVQGRNFTQAADLAGFADQAHFTRSFYEIFGAPPSRTLAQIRRLPHEKGARLFSD